ncbi:MAG: hypothetical protein L0Z62_16430 [Gemmataceae bacterium]|nr:hypothetical protein [Gemmataceae bacterium]
MSNALVPIPKTEASMVAQEMAESYRRMVEHHRQYYQLQAQEAVARTEGLSDPKYLEMILTRPPEQASWFDLHTLAQGDPALAQQRWEQIKQAAREELASKGRAAKALEGFGPGLWERAQFLALCQELADGWQPRNGIERQLLDTMAQAQTALLTWLTRLSNWTNQPGKQDQSEGAGWQPPRLTEAKAIEEAAGMVERFHRLFVRSLRRCATCAAVPWPLWCRAPGRSTSASGRSTSAGSRGPDGWATGNFKGRIPAPIARLSPATIPARRTSPTGRPLSTAGRSPAQMQEVAEAAVGPMNRGRRLAPPVGSRSRSA